MDFRDGRSMRVALIPHCALNQNARLAACAECPAAVDALVRGLLDRRVGMIQMPCPELLVIGLDRGHLQIRSALESRPARAALRALAKELVFQIAEYRRCGVRVLGILGKNGSPSCGVDRTSRQGKQTDGAGVFIEELTAELCAAGIDLPLAGMLDADPAAALALVDAWLQAPASPG